MAKNLFEKSEEAIDVPESSSPPPAPKEQKKGFIAPPYTGKAPWRERGKVYTPPKKGDDGTAKGL